MALVDDDVTVLSHKVFNRSLGWRNIGSITCAWPLMGPAADSERITDNSDVTRLGKGCRQTGSLRRRVPRIKLGNITS
jgi:hypothetical protein